MAEALDKEINWTAPEFVHYPKGKWWFILAAALAAIIIAYFLLQKDFLTATLFILLAAVVIYFARQPAKTLHIQLTHAGLKLNNVKVPYQQIKSFWIVYEPPEVKILNFETSAYLNRFITLQLTDQDPVAVRAFLLKYLPEDLDRGEQISDKLARGLKF